MALPYAVALVVVPDFGSKLDSLYARLHVWAVDTPLNRKAAEKIWSALPSRGSYDNETGVTIFTPHGTTYADWCFGVIDALDQHHDHSIDDPGYTLLEVYGIALTEAIEQAFSAFGFLKFVITTYGFIAQKAEP